jgi:hypothetical protein
MPVSPDTNPLTNEHCVWCNTVLQSSVITKELIDACKACGFEVGDAEAINNGHRKQAESIKAQFFPMNS